MHVVKLLRYPCVTPPVPVTPVSHCGMLNFTALVDVRQLTSVEVEAVAFDERTSDAGCTPVGCIPENTRDNNRGSNSRWSCRGTLVGGNGGCRINYNFGQRQDIHSLRIAFHEGTERTLALNVMVDGELHSQIESSGQTDAYQTFILDTESTSTISLNHDDFANRPNEWVSLTEVSDDATLQFSYGNRSLCRNVLNAPARPKMNDTTTLQSSQG